METPTTSHTPTPGAFTRRGGFTYGLLGLPLAFVALPLLGLFGYAPGARDAQGLSALVIAYCVLPCVLKLVAAACL